MCFSKAAPGVPNIPATPTEQDPAVKARLYAELDRQAKAKGLKSTILTGPQGVLDTATTAPKTLIGE